MRLRIDAGLAWKAVRQRVIPKLLPGIAHLAIGSPMKARLAYLTSPAPGVFVLNFQLDQGSEIQRVEIARAHLD
jgi:hypothetical protein